MPVYTLDQDLDGAEADLLDAVENSVVSRFFIEFLQQGGAKPHVVVRLVFARRTASICGSRWRGCRLAMDVAGGLNGIFHIKPLTYAEASSTAHAAFEFGLNRTDWTVGNYVDVLNQQPGLLDFNFVGGFYSPRGGTEYLDGCRDFITQFFIQLHRWEAVKWEVLRVDQGIFNDTNLRIEPGRTGFHEVIGYNYRAQGDQLTVVEPLPLARGNFNNVDFYRTVEYQLEGGNAYLLPYVPTAPQDRDHWYDTTLWPEQ